jgi:ABC-type proline/glycine betaine transport system permease subunit
VAYVLQGALVVGIFAIVTDLLFERVGRRLRRFATRD